jgi:general secretion pathway protein C
MARTLALNKAVRCLILVALLACLAYLATQTGRLLLLGPAAVTPPQALHPAPPAWRAPSAGTEPAATASRIQAWRLFGAYQAAPGASATNATGNTAPETKLDLTLLGVFRGATAKQGWAIIQAGESQAGLYRTGEVIDDGITLAALEPDHALLLRAGRLETLPLLAWDAMPGIVAATAETAPNNAEQPLDADKLLSNREQSMARLGIAPVSPGSASGYRVVDEKGQLVEQFHFQVGDTIVSANGYPLGTEEDDLLARRSLMGSGIANIIVMRGGTEFLLEYRAGSGQVRGMDALLAARAGSSSP